jgi:hypothetical protein
MLCAIEKLHLPGGNPTIVSYNASAVKRNTTPRVAPSAFLEQKYFILPLKTL